MFMYVNCIMIGSSIHLSVAKVEQGSPMRVRGLPLSTSLRPAIDGIDGDLQISGMAVRNPNFEQEKVYQVPV